MYKNHYVSLKCLNNDGLGVWRLTRGSGPIASPTSFASSRPGTSMTPTLSFEELKDCDVLSFYHIETTKEKNHHYNAAEYSQSNNYDPSFELLIGDWDYLKIYQ